MYEFFKDLAIILISAKLFGLLARRLKAPQVVGEILAGLLIGPCLLNWVQLSEDISTFAEVGVVLLMFSTGLGTNLKQLLKAGPIATLIACMGVAVPLAGGTLLYGAFYGFGAVGSPEFYKALFIGTILTATSVSITVATLQELGALKSFMGTTIVSAAVIDDVIGIIVLTCVLGVGSEGGSGSVMQVLLNTVLFFVVAIGIGILYNRAMTWLDNRSPHTQRITRKGRSTMNQPTPLSKWVHCPYCSAKTRIKIYPESILLYFPLYCPKCRNEYPVDIIHCKIYPAKKDDRP